ncbi:MAG: hypothetical protein U0841_30075, partial [Chloroflexia bacterium]
MSSAPSARPRAPFPWWQIGVYILLIAAAVVIVFPLLYALAVSFMTPDEASAFPPHFWPHAPNLRSYRLVLRTLPIPRYLLNSLLVSLAVVCGQLITASLAAYAFAMRK